VHNLAADAKPHTVIPVITVKWKADATQAQIANVMQVVASMPGKDSGILHVSKCRPVFEVVTNL
jgi:hypothetical protein